MIRILEVTGPVVFSDRFNSLRYAEQLRAIPFPAPVDVRSGAAFFYNMYTEVRPRENGVEFYAQKQLMWFVPCKYDYITFRFLPTSTMLADFTDMKFVGRDVQFNGPWSWSEGHREGVVWLLDAFVWWSKINDGDAAIGRKVLSYLIEPE